MDENIFSVTVEGIRLKLRVLSGLMMGLDGGSVDLETDEVHALGYILNNISDELKDWNYKEQKAAG